MGEIDVSMHMADIEDMGEFENNTPRPVDADSVARGSFDRLEEGQGAVQASRSARPAPQHAAQHATQHVVHHAAQEEGKPISKKVVATIVVGAVAAIAVAVFLFVRILSASRSSENTPIVEQTVVSSEEAISYRGYTYDLAKGKDAYYLEETRESGNGEKVNLGDLKGEPVSLVLYDGALIIPENLPDGKWDVTAYTIGSGWSSIMDQEGNVRAGDGKIEEARLDGSTLKLQIDGEAVDIPLVW